ncbi:hypothetical protein [Photobacterium damselae]|uniref:hypothetical protein n=1 Tax=Photobacterium damselae TaxID=38293 RepID=UPI0040683133
MSTRSELLKEINAKASELNILVVDVVAIADAIVRENNTKNPLESYVVISNVLFDNYAFGEKLSVGKKRGFKETLDDVAKLEREYDSIEDIIFINMREVYDELSEKVSSECMKDVESGADFSDCLSEINESINNACGLETIVCEVAEYRVKRNNVIECSYEQFGTSYETGELAVSMLENDGCRIGEYNPYNRSVWLINDSILTLGDNEQEALDNAADNGLLSEYALSHDEYDERCKDEHDSSCLMLGNASDPYDGDEIVSIKRIMTA